MDRNREARRASNMAAPPVNGISRRRHRSNSLRDSPGCVQGDRRLTMGGVGYIGGRVEYEDGGIEVHEGGRLRERGVVKKDRLDRDRDRERERSSSRSKRRRDNRMNMIHHNNNNHHSNHVTGASNRDEVDDTSDESVNDEDEDDDDGDALRMLPPLNPPSNHHTSNNHLTSLHHRKTFPPAVNNSSNNKLFRPAAPPSWKAADEMIGVSVPRKARSASTKRSHEWVSGVVGSGSVEQSHRQSSMSPVAASPAAPPSPSSSNVSKSNGGGVSKPRLPKSTSKSSSSNPEELEIEIAEVLYGLMTQSQAPAKKELPSNDPTNAKLDSNKSASDVSNPPQNSTSLSTVAPKRKRPRQVSENNPFSVRSSPVSSSVKTENDHQNHQQSPRTDSSGSAAAVVGSGENGVSFGFTSLPGHPVSSVEVKVPVVEEAKMVLTKEEVEKQSSAVGLNDVKSNNEGLITTSASIATTTNLKAVNQENQSQKEEKFEIDLMAPPPQQRTSPERDNGNIGFSDHKAQETSKNVKDKEDDKIGKSSKDETISLTEEQKLKAPGIALDTVESLKKAMDEERKIELRIDLEKPNKDSASMVSGGSNRSLNQVLKHQQAKSDVQIEKSAQPSSIPIPMANWPPMGYVAPLQGVISMDGNTMPQAPIQPIFTQPRPKRCATHCYIARNIHYLQQFMKINPFWPPASGTAAMFGAKPSNLNVMPSAELHGNIAGGPLQAMQDKGPGLGIFPGHTAGKDNKSAQATTVPDPAAQRKQQVMLQQTMPPVAPNNILHGPAFIFPFNQQQAVAASAASVRPGSSKLNTSTAGGLGGAAGSANSATVSSAATAAVPAMSFNYPNMGANETQYMAILQNNPFPYPIPAAVGGPPNYRANPHAQAMPLFNGSFYSSQMIHPSQIPQPSQQQAAPSQSQNHHPSQAQQISQTNQNSSGSTSSSQKHLQAQQQRQQQGSGAAVNGSGNGNSGSLHNSFPGHKNRSQQPSQHMNPPPQARHLENEVPGGEDSPSTADSRVSRGAPTMSVYGHNFAMPVNSQNFALMNAQGAMSNAPSGNSNDKKQQHHHQQQSQQQGLKRGGVDSSSLPPQTFAMSFAPMNGTAGTISSIAQSALYQSLPESLKQTYHMMAAPAGAASAHHSQQKKDFRISEEASRAAAGHDSSNADDDRKGIAGLTGKSGQSIAFSRPDLGTDATNSSGSISGTSVVDSSSRNINLGANNRSSRSPIPTSVAAAQSSHHLHAQFQQQQQHQQQQILQLQKQQQQNMNARSKNPPSSNGSAYPEHLMTSSSMAGKFPNALSPFPLQTSNSSSSPAQSPQWRNSVRGPSTSQGPSLVSATGSSLKNMHQAHQSPQAHQSHQSQQQQSSRSHPHSQTQISFGAASQKLPSTTSSQMQQQNQNHNPGGTNSNQSPSPPMLVGSPTTSSLSKGGGGGAGGSPRTNPSVSTSGRPAQASSLSSSQQAKNSPVGTQRSSPSPSILVQTIHSHQQHSGGSATASGVSGYYLSRKQQNQPQSQQQSQQNQQSSSTSMLSLCPPVTLANTTTSDPAKAIAAATSNLKGGAAQQGIMHAAQYSAAQSTSASHQLLPGGFPQYVHNPPAPVQVKSAEQKQPAGE
ncbi:protein time for coffee isoform X2 [Tanacetum coccineum]